MFESAITFWFKDVDFDGDKVWEYFPNCIPIWTTAFLQQF